MLAAALDDAGPAELGLGGPGTFAAAHGLVHRGVELGRGLGVELRRFGDVIGRRAGLGHDRVARGGRDIRRGLGVGRRRVRVVRLGWAGWLGLICLAGALVAPGLGPLLVVVRGGGLLLLLARHGLVPGGCTRPAGRTPRLAS